MISRGGVKINVLLYNKTLLLTSASEMTYIVSGGALNSTHSLLTSTPYWNNDFRVPTTFKQTKKLLHIYCKGWMPTLPTKQVLTVSILQEWKHNFLNTKKQTNFTVRSKISVLQSFYWNGSICNIYIAHRTSCSDTWVCSMPNRQKNDFPIMRKLKMIFHSSPVQFGTIQQPY